MDENGIFISPRHGKIFLNDADRASADVTIGKIRAAAASAFHLAQRLCFYVASVGSWDHGRSIGGGLTPQAMNEACVSNFLQLFALAGAGGERVIGVNGLGYRHDLARAIYGERAALFDPTFGIVFKNSAVDNDNKNDNYLDITELKNSKQKFIMQMSIKPYSRMPYAGLDLNATQEIESAIQAPSYLSEGKIKTNYSDVISWLLK